MNSKDPQNVAKAIAGAFLVSCLASGAMVTTANAETMANSATAKAQPHAKTSEGMMRHGCSSKHHAQKKNSGMMRHGCSSKTKMQKSGM